MEIMEKNKKLVTIYGHEGQHLIKTPKGEMIPGIIMTRVTDEVGSPPYVLAKIYCNIANNDDEFILP